MDVDDSTKNKMDHEARAMHRSGTRKVALLQGIQLLRVKLAQSSEDRIHLEAKLVAQKEKKEGAKNEVPCSFASAQARTQICTENFMCMYVCIHMFSRARACVWECEMSNC